MAVRRNLQDPLTHLASQVPGVAVTGPRQSGKTTLCQSAFPEKPYVSLEPLDSRRYAADDPREFLREYRDGAILDELARFGELPGDPWTQLWRGRGDQPSHCARLVVGARGELPRHAPSGVASQPSEAGSERPSPVRPWPRSSSRACGVSEPRWPSGSHTSPSTPGWSTAEMPGGKPKNGRQGPSTPAIPPRTPGTKRCLHPPPPRLPHRLPCPRVPPLSTVMGSGILAFARFSF